METTCKSTMIHDSNDMNLLSLPEIYEKVSNYFTSIILPNDEDVGTTDATDEELSDIIELITLLQTRVDETGLFSKDEEIDEHPTSSIRYLFIDYFAAKFHGKWRNIDERAFHLLLSKKHFENFKKICIEMKIMNDEEAKELRLGRYEEEEEEEDDHGSSGRSPKKKSTTLTPNEARMMKINKYKRDNACKKAIALLRQKLKNSKSQQSGESELDEETDTRELYVLQLQSYLRDTIDEIPLIVQEIQMLQMMKSLKSSATVGDHSHGTGCSSSSSSGNNMSSNGISVIKLNKTPDGQIIQTREQVKADVFKPRMSEPTMTLQEFGDLEYARAMERKAKEEQLAREGNDGEVLDFQRLYQQGKEDNESLMDAATEKARGWDEWTESSSANWKGAGNKANKRY